MIKEFRQEMEKRALVGALAIGGLTAMGIKDDIKTNKQKFGVKSGTPASGATRLTSPYKHQFGGSNVMKRSGTSPHSLY